jgi:DNA repair protein RadC
MTEMRDVRGRIFEIMSSLYQVDEQVSALAESLALPADAAEMWESQIPTSTPAHLYATLEAVRSDCLEDAMRTLLHAAGQSDISLRREFLRGRAPIHPGHPGAGAASDPVTSLARLDASPAVRRYLEAADGVERFGSHVAAPRPTLSCPQELAEYLLARHRCVDQEILGAVYVDVHHRLIADVELCRGTLDRLAVEPRVVLRHGLELGAASFLLWHTHPSGDPSPSAEDLDFTRRLASSAQLLGLSLLDHLILGHKGRWVSLRQRGAWDEEGLRSRGGVSFLKSKTTPATKPGGRSTPPC